MSQEQKYSFPYSAYQWSEGTDTQVTITFNTHSVTIRGQHLASLPDHLAAQQLRRVRVTTRADGLLSFARDNSVPVVSEIVIERKEED